MECGLHRSFNFLRRHNNPAIGLNVSIFLFFAFITACNLAHYTKDISSNKPIISYHRAVKEGFLPQGFGIFAARLGAVDLSPSSRPGDAPIIQIATGAKLKLRFDVLGLDVPVLAIRFKHFQPDWQDSGLPQPMFVKGNVYEIVNEQQVNNAMGPLYRSFSFEFPNKNLEFKLSGNYSMELFNPNTNEVWLRLPFFIHENAQNLSLKVESIYSTGGAARVYHQPFSIYKLPEFVQFPITQIQSIYFKNQYWGKPVIGDRIDQNIQGELGFHPSRKSSFVADEQVRVANLLDPKPDNIRILEVDNPDNVLSVILNRDIMGLDVENSRSNRLRSVASFGLQDEYIDVQFSLEANPSYLNEQVYLVGDFNQWTIDERYKLRSDNNPDFAFLQTNVRLKEGVYGYKYVLLNRFNELNTQEFVNPFASYTNRYDNFIYYYDPDLMIHRLLQVSSTMVSE